MCAYRSARASPLLSDQGYAKRPLGTAQCNGHALTISQVPKPTTRQDSGSPMRQ
jgi:hypothetical protein